MTTRRSFIKKAGLAAGAVTIIPRYVLGGNGFVAPSDKIYVAGIGVGGKGESDIAMFAKSGKAEISFLCDVDDRRAANTVKNFPKAKYYKDYRKMLDENHKSIMRFPFLLPITCMLFRLWLPWSWASMCMCKSR